MPSPLEIEETAAELLKAVIGFGMGAVPKTVPDEYRALAEAAIKRGAVWLLRQLKPEAIKVLLEDTAKASAEIDWGEEKDDA